VSQNESFIELAKENKICIVKKIKYVSLSLLMI